MCLTCGNAYHLIIIDGSIKGEYNYCLSRTCLQVFKNESIEIMSPFSKLSTNKENTSNKPLNVCTGCQSYWN